MKINLLIQLAVIYTLILQSVSQPPRPLVTSCNDPLIQRHLVTFGHSYCFHTCGFFTQAGGRALILDGNLSLINRTFPLAFGNLNLLNNITNTAPTGVCNANGNCVCRPGCPTKLNVTTAAVAALQGNFTNLLQQQIPTIDPGLCPLNINTDVNTRTRCQTTCTQECPFGGQWRICRDSDATVNANVCTCSCPINPLTCAVTKNKKFKLLKKFASLKYLKYLSVLANKLWPIFLFIFKLAAVSVVKFALIIGAVYVFELLGLSFGQFQLFLENLNILNNLNRADYGKLY